MRTNNDKFLNMIHRYDDELFSAVFYLENGLSRCEIIEIFILLNKFYPSYMCLKYAFQLGVESRKNVKWEDVVLGRAPFIVEGYMDFYFNVPFFVQKEGMVESVYTEESGINLTLEKDERFGFVLIIDVCFNAFANKNYFVSFNEVELDWGYVETDQSLAACKNRNTLAGLLQELENLLELDISGFESSIFDDEHIYKYGFKDSVRFLEQN